MLEQMRNATGSFVIWILFAVIIAAFVLFFGSPSDSLGCGSKNEYAIQVEEEDVSVHSWRFAYHGLPFLFGRSVPSDQRKPLALEFLLQREILAQAAEKLDFFVSDEMIDNAIKNGEFYFMANKLNGTQFYFENSEELGFFFDYGRLEGLVSRLSLPSVARYKTEQRREMLAYFMKQELLHSGHVSEEEARQNFIQGHTTVSADYVKFEISDYLDAVELTEESVQSFADSNDEDLKAQWEQVKPRWEGDKARVRARIIKVARTVPVEVKAPTLAPEDGGEEDVDGETPAPDKAVEEAPLPVADVQEDPARDTIAAARDKILAGSDFASVAMETSQDRTASLGGWIGWRAADSMGYGQEVVDGSKELEIGKVSEIIESGTDFFLVTIEERSDKSLSYDQKKFDLAVKSAPREIARQNAKAAAQAALASAADTPLSDLFEKEAGIPNMNGLPPEILDQLTPEQLEQFMKNATPGPNGGAIPGSESGALIVEGRNRYAQLGGAEPTAKPAAPPAKPAAAKPMAPPKLEKAKEKPTPALGAGTIAEATAEADPSAVPAPPLESFKGTTRNGDFIAGLGRSQELVSAIFGELAPDALAPKVYEVSFPNSDPDALNANEAYAYVVLQMTDRTEADMEEFAETATSLQSTLSGAKGGQLLQSWLARQCLKLKKAGAIKPNYGLLRTGADDAQIPYEPCSYLTETP